MTIRITEKSYKTECLIFIGFVILLALIAIITNTKSCPKWLEVIFSIITLLEIIILIPFSIARMYSISNNREMDSFKKGQTKYKFSYKEYLGEEIIFWVKNAIEPDTLYVTSVDGKHYIIEVVFATIGKMGPFVDKGYCIDKNEVSENDLLSFIVKQLLDSRGLVKVDAITEKNNPILFEKTLSELRKKIKKQKFYDITLDLRSISNTDKDRIFNFNNNIKRYAYVAANWIKAHHW